VPSMASRVTHQRIPGQIASSFPSNHSTLAITLQNKRERCDERPVT
jgi:hypothetical protein